MNNFCIPLRVKYLFKFYMDEVVYSSRAKLIYTALVVADAYCTISAFSTDDLPYLV